MNCYGLVRVSTIGQEDNTSIGFQTEKIEGYSKLHDLELKDVFVDVMSGASENRDGMQELSEGALITPLIKAVQELSAEVNQLKQQLKDK